MYMIAEFYEEMKVFIETSVMLLLYYIVNSGEHIAWNMASHGVSF